MASCLISLWQARGKFGISPTLLDMAFGPTRQSSSSSSTPTTSRFLNVFEGVPNPFTAYGRIGGTQLLLPLSALAADVYGTAAAIPIGKATP